MGTLGLREICEQSRKYRGKAQVWRENANLQIDSKLKSKLKTELGPLELKGSKTMSYIPLMSQHSLKSENWTIVWHSF